MSNQTEGPAAPRKRSGGPKSPAGKARSALNALKHGRYAKSLSVLSIEDDQVFLELLDAYNAHLQPQNPVQARLVNEIAHIDWTLARWRSIEVAHINRAFDLRAHPHPLDAGGLQDLTAVLEAEINDSRFPFFITARIGRLLTERNNALRTLRALRRYEPLPRPSSLDLGGDEIFVEPHSPHPASQPTEFKHLNPGKRPVKRTGNELKK